MAKHRTHSIEFKRQVSQEDLSGETLHGLSQRHDLSRNLIRIWIENNQAGGLDEDAAAADLLESYEARIAALERLVVKQALELKFLRKAPRAGLRPRSAATSAITALRVPPQPTSQAVAPGPLRRVGCPSPKDFMPRHRAPGRSPPRCRQSRHVQRSRRVQKP